MNNSLAYFNLSDFPPNVRPNDIEIKPQYNKTQFCRYPDYREPPWSPDRYKYTSQHWHVVAAQFIFLVVFENLVILATSAIAYIIPDVPRQLNEQMRQEAVITNNIILETELLRYRGSKDATLCDDALERIRSRTGNRYNSGSGDCIRLSKSNSCNGVEEAPV